MMASGASKWDENLERIRLLNAEQIASIALCVNKERHDIRLTEAKKPYCAACRGSKTILLAPAHSIRCSTCHWRSVPRHP